MARIRSGSSRSVSAAVALAFVLMFSACAGAGTSSNRNAVPTRSAQADVDIVGVTSGAAGDNDLRASEVEVKPAETSPNVPVAAMSGSLRSSASTNSTAILTTETVVPDASESAPGEELKYGLFDSTGFAIPGVASHGGYFDVMDDCVIFVAAWSVDQTPKSVGNREPGEPAEASAAVYSAAFPVGLYWYLSSADSTRIPENRFLEQEVVFRERQQFGLVAMEIDGRNDERLVQSVPSECPREALLIGEAWPRG